MNESTAFANELNEFTELWLANRKINIELINAGLEV
jgi:hypothetical protein